MNISRLVVNATLSITSALGLTGCIGFGSFSLNFNSINNVPKVKQTFTVTRKACTKGFFDISENEEYQLYNKAINKAIEYSCKRGYCKKVDIKTGLPSTTSFLFYKTVCYPATVKLTK